MSILKTQLVTTGMSDAPTSFIFIKTNDTAATVLTNGYLSSNLLAEDLSSLSNYSAALVYTTDIGTILYTVQIVGGVASLLHPPTLYSAAQPPLSNFTVGHIPQIIGTSGYIEYVDSGIVGADILVNTVNNVMADGSSIEFSNGSYLQMDGGSYIAMEPTAYISLDKGAVTQTGLSTSGVTLNTQAGAITTVTQLLLPGITTSFTLTNSEILATSIILVSLMGGSNTTPGVQLSATPANGSATIRISNNNAATTSGGSPANLNGTLVIGFVVF